MTVTTNERGQNNMFAREPQMYIDKTEAERYGYETYAERAEKLNGRTAMLGLWQHLFHTLLLVVSFLRCLRHLMIPSLLSLILSEIYNDP